MTITRLIQSELDKLTTTKMPSRHMEQNQGTVRALALSVLLVMLAACGDTTTPRTSSNGPYAAAFERWQAADITDYSIIYFVTGGIGRVGPKVVQVENGEAVEVDATDPTQIAPSYSVDDLFDELNAAEIVVDADFDPELGFPTRLELDPIEDAIDDEFSVEVTALEPTS